MPIAFVSRLCKPFQTKGNKACHVGNNNLKMPQDMHKIGSGHKHPKTKTISTTSMIQSIPTPGISTRSSSQETDLEAVSKHAQTFFVHISDRNFARMIQPMPHHGFEHLSKSFNAIQLCSVSLVTFWCFFGRFSYLQQTVSAGYIRGNSQAWAATQDATKAVPWGCHKMVSHEESGR